MYKERQDEANRRNLATLFDEHSKSYVKFCAFTCKFPGHLDTKI